MAGDDVFNGGGALIGTDGPGPVGSADATSPFLPYQASSGQAHALLRHFGPDQHTPFSLGKAAPGQTPAAIYVIKGKRDGTYLTAYRREKLAALFAAKDKDRAPAETEALLWETKNVPVLVNDGHFTGMATAHSIATAASQVLVAGTSEVVALDEIGQKELARFKVEGNIRRNGLSVSRGKAYIVTEEGCVARLGND